MTAQRLGILMLGCGLTVGAAACSGSSTDTGLGSSGGSSGAATASAGKAGANVSGGPSVGGGPSANGGASAAAGHAGASQGGASGGHAGSANAGASGIAGGGGGSAGVGGHAGSGGGSAGAGGHIGAAGGTSGGSAGAGGYAGGAGGTNGGSAGAGGASAGSGGSSGAAAGASGAAGGSGCSGLSQTRSSRSAKSGGFTGDYNADYYPLYSHACTTVADCSAACVTAGGTQASCAASECEDSTPDYCLPPTYWFGLDQLLVQGNTQDSSAWIIMVNNPYRDQLLATNFQFEIPAAAKIDGIQFAVNESADSANEIGDYSVHALSGGNPAGLDRGHTTAWPTDFQFETYGGATDLWGTTWTADSVNAADFGIALTPLYLDTAGNARGYVDFITATVYYDTCN